MLAQALCPDPLAANRQVPVAGIAEDRLYLSLGRGGVEMLKRVIDASSQQSGKEIPPGRISAAGAPIATFAAGVTQGLRALMITGWGLPLQGSDGKDHLTITTNGIPNGVGIRVEIEEDVLKLIGSLSALAQQKE